MAMRRLSGAGAIAALWLVAGLVATTHMGLQYMQPSGAIAGARPLVGSSHRVGATRTAHRVTRGCAVTDDLDVAPGPDIGWGPSWGGKEAVTAVSILGTLAICLSQSDPWHRREGAKTQNTLPFSRSFRALGTALDKLMPSRAQKVREQQQEFVTTVAVLVPMVAGCLSKSGGIDVGFLGDTKTFTELETGKVYEAKDAAGNWWPVVVESSNGDESYTCTMISKGDKFEDERVWSSVWPGNCRTVRQPERVMPDMLANCAV